MTPVKPEQGSAKVAKEKLVIKPKTYRGPTAVVSARLPGEMVQAIDRIAKKTGYNRNEIIEKCLEFAIGNMEGDAK